MHVILFDIDGTLIQSKSVLPAAQECFKRAILGVAGVEPAVDPWRFGGMVDAQICRELMLDAGLERDKVDRLVFKATARMEEIYPSIRKEPVLNSGVKELLAILKASSRHRLGVITGNLEVIAEEKLRRTGIRDYFDEPFYSNGYLDRRTLAKDAVEECVAKYALHDSGRVILVGDTPQDIEAAKASLSRSIGVASGRFTMSALIDAGANTTLESLVPCGELLRALGIEEQS